MEENIISAEELAQRLQDIVARLKAMGRSDLILRSIGGSTLEELKLETAKHTLSRLVVTSDFRFLLPTTATWRWIFSLCIRQCICCF